MAETKQVTVTFTFEYEGDFIPMRGFAILEGFNESNEMDLRLVPFEDTPFWTIHGLLDTVYVASARRVEDSWNWTR